MNLVKYRWINRTLVIRFTHIQSMKWHLSFYGKRIVWFPRTDLGQEINHAKTVVMVRSSDRNILCIALHQRYCLLLPDFGDVLHEKKYSPLEESRTSIGSLMSKLDSKRYLRIVAMISLSVFHISPVLASLFVRLPSPWQDTHWCGTLRENRNEPIASQHLITNT